MTNMRIHAMDDDGQIIGAADILCRRWTLENGAFLNDDYIDIPVSGVGTVTKCEIFTNGVLTQRGPLTTPNLSFPTCTVRVAPRHMRIEFAKMGYNG